MGQPPKHSDTLSATQTQPAEISFDFSAYPPDTLFHDRRKNDPGASGNRPVLHPRKERRRRVDPTTFEKQYTPEELEFMAAMQRFKNASGKAFPSHGEVLRVAHDLGYRKIEEG